MRQHAPSSTVFWNFLAVGSGEAIARLVAFAGLLFVARQVGAGGYGVISFAAGVTLYLTRVADFGIDTLGTVEIARHPDEISRRASAIPAWSNSCDACRNASPIETVISFRN